MNSASKRGNKKNRRTLMAQPGESRWKPIKKIGVVFTCVFGFLSVWLFFGQLNALMDLFPIKQVSIEGTFKHVEKREVQGLIEDRVTTNYFVVDLYAIRNQIKTLPWVEDAKVSRTWPSKIVIKIAERKPVAFWGSEKLISNKGEIFDSVGESIAKGLPRLNGIEKKSRFIMQNYHAMSGAFRNLKLRITELELNDRYTWRLKLDNDIELIVDKKNSLQKIHRFVGVYDRWLTLDSRKIVRVDLRYKNGMAIKWSEGTGEV